MVGDLAVVYDYDLGAGLGDVIDDVGGQQHGAVARERDEQVAEPQAFFGIETSGGPGASFHRSRSCRELWPAL